MLSNRSMPRSTVIPQLPYPDVREAVDWLCAAFGFTLRILIAGHRAQLSVGDGAIVITRQAEVAARCAVMVRVDDVDAHYERSRRHGATILQAPATFPYGERQYSASDHAGHQWIFSESVADVDPAEWGGHVGQL